MHCIYIVSQLFSSSMCLLSYSGIQLQCQAVLSNLEYKLYTLSWCKQMVWTVMTSFWFQPDRDKGCQPSFQSSAEVEWVK